MDKLLDLPFGIPPWAVAALGGVVYAMWDRVKLLLSQVTSHAVTSVTMDTDLGFTIAEKLYHKYGVSRFGSRGLLLKNVQAVNGAHKWVVTRWLPNSDTLVWVPRWGVKLPVILKVHEGNVIATFLRGTLDLNAEIIEMLEKANAWSGNRFSVIRLGGSAASADGKNGVHNVQGSDNYFSKNYKGLELVGAKYEDIGPEMPPGDKSTLWLCDSAKRVLADATTWLKSREWYKSHRQTWRRGWLISGSPGVGKTSLIRAVAIELNIPICQLDLGSMDNSDLEHAWQTVMSNTPCIVLLEDIDSVYIGRKPVLESRVSAKGPPTLDHLLNRLDGADSCDGVLVFITTNVPTNVDTALGGQLDAATGGTVPFGTATRPGRIDVAVQLPKELPEAGYRHIASRILDGHPDLVEEAVQAAKGSTPAQFQELCVKLAFKTIERLHGNN